MSYYILGLQGIYVSRVQENSLAEKCGLSNGDQILAVNYTSFLDGTITCQQAFNMICDNECLLMSILPRREAILRQQQQQQQQRRHQYWVDADGQPINSPDSPPSDSIISSSDKDSPTEQRIATKINPGFSRGHKRLPTNQLSEVRTVISLFFIYIYIYIYIIHYLYLFLS